MTDKLACIILDALGPLGMRQLDMSYVHNLYKTRTAGLMACTGLAHTPISNSMIWGQYHNDNKIWVEFDTHRWTGGVDGFDPVDRVKDEGAEFYERSDFPTNYVWDVLDYHDFEACALGIPISLPPHDFNALDTIEEAWFPHTEDLLERHVRRKFEILHKHVDAEYEFIACSIKVPDQWLHGMGSDLVDELFVQEEVRKLENRLQDLVPRLEEEGYDWMLFGDHGAPIGGRTLDHDSKTSLARHRKEAAIIGSTDSVPRYTGEMYPFILDYFDVEDVDKALWVDEEKYPPIEELIERAREEGNQVEGTETVEEKTA